MKKFAALALGAAMTVSATVSAASAEPIVIKIGHSSEADLHLPGAGRTACVVAMKEYLDVASEGELALDVYPDGALGGARAMVESAQTGVIQMVGAYTSILVPFVSEMAVTQIPYVFPDSLTAWQVMDGPFGDALAETVLEKTGLRVLAWPEGAGFRNIYADKPIHSVADMKGMKMRVPENPGLLAMFRAWGANTVTISWNELYTALQSGMAAGHDTELYSMYSSKLYEVNPYVTVTRHSYNLHPVLINEEFFQSLSPENQTLILRAGDLCNRVGNAQSLLSSLVIQSAMEKEGAVFYYPTKAELAEFRELSQKPYVDMVLRQMGPDGQEWVDRILAATKEAETQR
ncbi:TRAP transporter substrate-binding protein [Martelella soudanensis]|uniref:TRAP transporter substrate-binding protein n=1 Tax=unclassified Martelella TaxID=2629616 RepID=UPI0015DD7D32|nr:MULTISPECIES: TRAP transporter substrate-binding protein [unclassified Martelella]